MADSTRPEQPDQLNVHACVAEGCDSILFFDWGLQLLANSGYITPLGPGQQPFTSTYHVRACARCRTPQVVIDGNLIDLSKLISPEEVESTIRVGQAVHPARKDP